MKIAIVNDIHIGQALIRSGKMRAASHLVREILPNFLDYIIKQHSPDLLINLGDLIRSVEKYEDLKNYKNSIQDFKGLSCPVIHLIGNHDIKKLAVNEVEQIWQELGFHQKSYGIKEIGGVTFLWLGMDYQPEKHCKFTLPSDQLTWLENTLNKIQQPTIIFSHCAIDDQDVTGNFFYEGYEVKHKRDFFLENAEKIQKTISKNCFVKMVVQAHLHYFHAKIYHGIPHITCPAMADNLCAPSISEHIPEIYSMLMFSEKQLVLKAFSREYCFAGSEFDLTK